MMRRPSSPRWRRTRAPFPVDAAAQPVAVESSSRCRLTANPPSDTGDGDGDSVIGAATDRDRGRRRGRVPRDAAGRRHGRRRHRQPSTIPVDTPIAVDPASTTIGAASASPATGDAGRAGRERRADAIDTAAWTDAAARPVRSRRRGWRERDRTALAAICWRTTQYRGRRDWRMPRSANRSVRRRRSTPRSASQRPSALANNPSRTAIIRRSQRQCSSRAERDGLRHDGGRCRGCRGHDGRGTGADRRTRRSTGRCLAIRRASRR